jgi:hypothetical protein
MAFLKILSHHSLEDSKVTPLKDLSQNSQLLD